MVPMEKRKDTHYRSCCADFFVAEDGVISLSLKGMTLIGCITITVALLTKLYLACHSGEI